MKVKIKLKYNQLMSFGILLDYLISRYSQSISNFMAAKEANLLNIKICNLFMLPRREQYTINLSQTLILGFYMTNWLDNELIGSYERMMAQTIIAVIDEQYISEKHALECALGNIKMLN